MDLHPSNKPSQAAGNAANPQVTNEPTADADDERLIEIWNQIEAGELSIATALEQFPAHAQQLQELHDQHEHMRQLVRSDEQTPTIPQRFDEFVIERSLESGGMGVLYLAKDTRLNRHVAIKMIRADRMSPDMVAYFRREQLALARLHHTNIVPIFSSGMTGEFHYFVMPMIAGTSLEKVIRLAKFMERGEATSSIDDCSALAKLIISDSRQSARTASAGGTKVDETLSWRNSHRTGIQAQRSSLEVRADDSLKAAREPDDGHEAAIVAAKQVRFQFTQKYFRSVVKLMVQAAEAAGHAHLLADPIVHRDIKPANIMIDSNGHCWMIDFGLARFVARKSPSQAIATSSNSDQTGAAGTRAYMAPEQIRGEPDCRSDVWALGVTLYELLTHRLPFRTTDETLADRPAPRPRQIRPEIPLDLDAICAKCMQTNVAHRYQNGKELAADLARFLAGQSVMARPRALGERLLTVARENIAWAICIASILVGLLAVSIATTLGLSNARKTIAEQDRQLNVYQITQSLNSPRIEGWRTDVLNRLKLVKNRDDSRLRDLAVMAFEGLDSQAISKPLNIYASSAAFDATGQRIALGGAPAWGQGKPIQPSRIWTVGAEYPLDCSAKGPGPVTFDRANKPVQLVHEHDLTYLLWEIETGNAVAHLRYEPATPSTKLVPILADDNTPVMALSKTARFAAGSLREITSDATQSATGVTVVWNMDAKRQWTLPIVSTSAKFSDDDSLLALGTSTGDLVLVDVIKQQVIFQHKVDTRELNALAFTHDATILARQEKSSDLWGQLCFACSGGSVTCLNLATRQPVSNFVEHGEVASALEYNPDNTLLSVQGISTTIRDAATGTKVLSLNSRQGWCPAAFSPDGSLIVTSSTDIFGSSATTLIRKIQNGLGIRSFHGLRSPSRMIWSDDGSVLVGQSSDWKLNVWNAATSTLLLSVDVPPGLFPFNAGFAISDKGDQLAVASGERAELWDIQKRRRSKSWKLPPGATNCVAFRGDELLLYRVETKDQQRYPDSRAPKQQFPRVSVIRQLRETDDAVVLWTTSREPYDLYGVHQAAMSRDGKWLAIHDLAGEHREHNSVRLFDAKSGTLQHEFPADPNRDAGPMFDHHSSLFRWSIDGNAAQVVSLKAIDKVIWKGGSSNVTFDEQHVSLTSGDLRWLSLHTMADGRERFRLSNCPSASLGPSSKRKQLAVWSNRNNFLQSVDIKQVEQQLTDLGFE